MSNVIHETLLVSKLETFQNCKEAKHIMIDYCTNLHFFLS